MYDKDKEQIFHLHALGVPIGKIISTHIKYGKYWSLKNYIEKRYKSSEVQSTWSYYKNFREGLLTSRNINVIYWLLFY